MIEPCLLAPSWVAEAAHYRLAPRSALYVDIVDVVECELDWWPEWMPLATTEQPWMRYYEEAAQA